MQAAERRSSTQSTESGAHVRLLGSRSREPQTGQLTPRTHVSCFTARHRSLRWWQDCFLLRTVGELGPASLLASRWCAVVKSLQLVGLAPWSPPSSSQEHLPWESVPKFLFCKNTSHIGLRPACSRMTSPELITSERPSTKEGPILRLGIKTPTYESEGMQFSP